MDVRARLEQLGAELAGRGWSVQVRGTVKRPYLRVVNPDDLALNGMVVALGDQYRWTWGPVLGQADDVHGVADRILHVLRGVAP
jgi:hypothetical protein